MIRNKARLICALAGTIAALCVSVPSAGAATNLGETFAPPDPCGTNTTYLVTESVDDAYTVPSSGVITGWSFRTGSVAPEVLRLKVGRAVSGTDLSAPETDLSIVGESISQVPSASSLNSFSARVSVQKGDFLGLYLGGGGGLVQCADQSSAMGYQDHYNNSDVLAGTSAAFTQEADGQIEVAAVLEPDADNDGFGDETQDQCPSNAGVKGPCPVTPLTPVTTAKKKCKKHKKHHSAESAKKKCKKKKKKR